MTYIISLIQMAVSFNKKYEQSDPRLLMGMTSVISVLLYILI